MFYLNILKRWLGVYRWFYSFLVPDCEYFQWNLKVAYYFKGFGYKDGFLVLLRYSYYLCRSSTFWTLHRVCITRTFTHIDICKSVLLWTWRQLTVLSWRHNSFSLVWITFDLNLAHLNFRSVFDTLGSKQTLSSLLLALSTTW